MVGKIIDNYALARQELHYAERDRHVKMLFACESGSRAWGFASKNSDYDIRFFYVRPLNSYLGLSARRDVLENADLKPRNILFDLSGWDVLKALALAGTSNPQVIEWLNSPIHYYEYAPFGEELRDIVKEYNPRKIAYHYASMAHKQYKTYLTGTGEKVIYKKYLYALRPIFAVLCLQRDPLTFPSVNFHELWDQVSLHPQVRSIQSELQDLLRVKELGREEDLQQRYASIDAFIAQMVATTREIASDMFDGRGPDLMRLEDLSVRTIRQFSS